MTTASGGTSCIRYQPIEWSVDDTDYTIEKVKEHNAVWLDACR